MENLKRLGTPWKLPYQVKCKVCQTLTNNATKVCHDCNHLVVGKFIADTSDGRQRIRFHQITKSENEWDFVLPRR